MLQDSMPGEARMSNGVPSDLRGRKAASQDPPPPNEAVQEMAEKLERSEAGRKKLRQAISMLKEKVEANEKVLQVNEILRQECETQRLRAETESKKAEEERKLREEAKVEGLSSTEQLKSVLKRLDAVERSCKADRDETEKLRKETKQALLGLNGAVKAIEAAHASFDSLEKNLISKVNVGISASTKSSSLAQTAISDSKGARGTATAAEKLSQSLVPTVSELQKQCAGLNQRMNILDQEIRMRPLTPAVSLWREHGKKLQIGDISVPGKTSSKEKGESLLSRGHERITECTTSCLKASRIEVAAKTADKDGVACCGSPGHKQDCMATKAQSFGIGIFSTAKVQERPSADCSGFEQTESSPNSCRISSVREALNIAKKRKLCALRSRVENFQPPAIVSACETDGALGSAAPPFNTTAEKVAEVGAGITPDRNTIAAVVEKEGKESVAGKEGKIAVVGKEGKEAVGRKEGKEAIVGKEGKEVVVGNEGKEAVAGNEAGVGKEGKEAVVEGKEAVFGKEDKEAVVGTEDEEIDVGKEGEEALVGKESQGPVAGKDLNEVGGTSSLRNQDGGERTFGSLKLCTRNDVPEPAKGCFMFSPSQVRKGKRSKELACGHEISTNDQSKEDVPALLLRDITTLYQEGKTSHKKMGQKLATLERVLQIDSRIGGYERKLDCSDEKSRKRKRTKLKKKTKELRVFNAQRTLNETTESADKACPPVSVQQAIECNEAEASIEEKQEIVIVKDLDDSIRLLSPKSLSPLRILEHDAGEEGRSCVKGADTPESPGLANESAEDPCPEDPCASPLLPAVDDLKADLSESTNADIYVDALSDRQIKGPWETDSEFSEDELGDVWWTTKPSLLSPTLPEVLEPLSEDSEPVDPLRWPCADDMQPEQIDHFLSVLPPIEQEVCDEGRREAWDEGRQESSDQGRQDLRDQSVVEVIPTSCDNPEVKASGLCLPSTDSHLQEDVWITREQVVDDRFHANPESLTSHPCTASSSGKSSVDCLEDGSKALSKPDDCKEERNEIVTEESSVCNQSESGTPRRVSFVDLVQKAEVHSLNNSSDLLSMPTTESRSDVTDVLGESPNAVKQEQLGTETSPTVGLHEDSFLPSCLELVFGDLQAEDETTKPLANTVENSVLPCMPEGSNEIFTAFGRTQKILKSLSLTACSGLGSGLAVAQGITSVLLSSRFSILDLLCIFTSGLVDSFVLWNDENSTPNLTWRLLHLLVDVVKHVLISGVFRRGLSPDLALSLFAVQLQKFLIEGKISQFFKPEHVQEASTKAQRFHFIPGMSAEKRRKAFTSGSMLLAAFCEATGKLGFLRNCVYLVLRFCETDSCCLLEIISSIACVCSKSLLLSEREDVIGQAVHVVTSELLHDVDAGDDSEPNKSIRDTVEGQPWGQEGGDNETDKSSNSIPFLGNLSVLRKIVGNEPDMNLGAFVPKVMDSLHLLISGTFDSHGSHKNHLLQKILWITTCDSSETKSKNSAPFVLDDSVEVFPKTCLRAALSSLNGSAGQIVSEDDLGYPAEDYVWRLARNNSTEPCSSSQPAANHLKDETSCSEEWEQKFYDISAALELISCQLGWEWTYNDLILEHLWKLVAPGASVITVACVAYLFGLLGRLGREVDTDLPGVDELRKSLSIIISPTSGDSTAVGGAIHFSFTAQVAAAQSLLVLFGFNRFDSSAAVMHEKDSESCFIERTDTRAYCANALRNWVKASKREIQEMLPLPLRHALLSVERYIPSTLR